jgi:hypothetical protein
VLRNLSHEIGRGFPVLPRVDYAVHTQRSLSMGSVRRFGIIAEHALWILTLMVASLGGG